jgi:hypothetical protein
MDDLGQYCAPELHEAVRRFGFDKVAARMYGVEEITEKTAANILGEKMMTRLAEQRTVAAGLAALKSLGG